MHSLSIALLWYMWPLNRGEDNPKNNSLGFGIGDCNRLIQVSFTIVKKNDFREFGRHWPLNRGWPPIRFANSFTVNETEQDSYIIAEYWAAVVYFFLGWVKSYSDDSAHFRLSFATGRPITNLYVFAGSVTENSWKKKTKTIYQKSRKNRNCKLKIIYGHITTIFCSVRK